MLRLMPRTMVSSLLIVQELIDRYNFFSSFVFSVLVLHSLSSNLAFDEYMFTAVPPTINTSVFYLPTCYICKLAFGQSRERNWFYELQKLLNWMRVDLESSYYIVE